MCGPVGCLPELVLLRVVACAVFAAAFDDYTVFIGADFRQGFLVADVFTFAFISFTVPNNMVQHMQRGDDLQFGREGVLHVVAKHSAVLLFWAIFGVLVWHQLAPLWTHSMIGQWRLHNPVGRAFHISSFAAVSI